MEENSRGGSPELPLDRGDGLLFHPGEVSLGVDVTGQGQQEVGGWRTVLLHLGRQVQTHEAKQLDLVILDLDAAEDKIKVCHGQMKSHVTQGQILLNLD